MATRIKCELTKSGIDAAIARLSMYSVSKIEPAADELARGVADKVKGHMGAMAHVQTGDLKENILGAQLRHEGPGEYVVVVDPVHQGFHYAETERSRGGESVSDGTPHDFTRGNQAFASEEAPILWEAIRTKL